MTTTVPSPFTIEKMKPEDWSQVRKIYADGIATNNATFETEVPSWEEWDAHHHQKCRFVARANETIFGWAALGGVSRRHVYRGVSEVTIYVDIEHFGLGIGSALMRALVEASEICGFWTLFSSIFPENKTSIALHEKYGFRVLGVRERIAQRNGIWRDTVIMERRSSVVGVD